MLTVRLAEADRPRTADIAKAAGLIAVNKKSWWSRNSISSSGILTIGGPAGGCGCSFLGDNADWNAPIWEMIPETLPRLVFIVKAIHENTTESFTFDALWIDASPAQEKCLMIDDLIQLITNSRLGTKTRYIIEATQISKS